MRVILPLLLPLLFGETIPKKRAASPWIEWRNHPHLLPKYLSLLPFVEEVSPVAIGCFESKRWRTFFEDAVKFFWE
jgi:hypothetical protein